MKTFALFMSYLPQILAGVKAIEDATHGASGTSKKQMILNVIQASAAAGETIPEAHVAGISSLIDSTVKTLNDSGVFKK